jgi:basic membrane protein A and related proteins
VKRKTLMTLAAAGIVGVLAVAIAAAAGMGRAAPAKKNAAVKVALVTDIGGLNDHGFNHLAYVGLQKAIKAKLITKANGRVYITQSASDRKPNLQSAAQAGYGLVIATGVLFEFGPLNDVAPAFPNTKFAGVDVEWGANGLNCPACTNVRGIQFREQEAGYLVGYIAGLWEKRHPKKGHNVVGGVGANKVPAIVRYLAGYKAGVHKAWPKVKVLIDYANDPTFNDQAKCRETTQTHLGQGSRVEFMAAGGCGLGGLKLAKQAHIWGIGVDADQGFLGKHILTSATKHVDLAVFQAIKAFKASPSGFAGGFNKNYTVKNHGVGYGKLSKALSKADRAYITKKVNAIAKLIAKGKIKPPSA